MRDDLAYFDEPPRARDIDLPPVLRRAVAKGRKDLLHDDYDTWLRANLPKFAAMAEVLRSEAAKFAQPERPHLRLAAWFDGLSLDPSRQPDWSE